VKFLKFLLTGLLAAGWNLPAQAMMTGSLIASTTPLTITTYTPSEPTFSDGGTEWTIDTVNPELSGAFVFDPYTASITAVSVLHADITYPSRRLTITGGTTAFDAASRTLSRTGVTFVEALFGTTCTGEAIVCSVQLTTTPITGDVTLIFDNASLTTYTGVANTTQVLSTLPGFATSTLAFSGYVVPVPAAAWLFGSALLSLGGRARYRRNNAIL